MAVSTRCFVQPMNRLLRLTIAAQCAGCALRSRIALDAVCSCGVRAIAGCIAALRRDWPAGRRRAHDCARREPAIKPLAQTLRLESLLVLGVTMTLIRAAVTRALPPDICLNGA